MEEENDMEDILCKERSKAHRLQEAYHTCNVGIRDEAGRKEDGIGEGGKGREQGGKVGENEDPEIGWEEISQLREDIDIVALNRGRRVAAGKKKKRGVVDSISTMVLYRGERWSKEELREWMESKKRNKLEEELNSMASRRSKIQEKAVNKVSN